MSKDLIPLHLQEGGTMFEIHAWSPDFLRTERNQSADKPNSFSIISAGS